MRLSRVHQPDAVVGMVLVDASLHSEADVDGYFADKGEVDLEQLKTDFATGPEPILWTIHDEARAAVEHIPDIPITYLRALQDSDLPPEAQEIWEGPRRAACALVERPRGRCRWAPHPAAAPGA